MCLSNVEKRVGLPVMWSEAPESMTHLEAEDNKHVLELPVSANVAVGAVEFLVPKSRAYSSAEIVTVLWLPEGLSSPVIFQ